MDMFQVGASVLDILTESLYDKPLVVFREYVQNSVDSISKDPDKSDTGIDIWECDRSLFFLDNGLGIKEDAFLKKMTSIGASSKRRNADVGYKGIGRLSGISYCEKIRFINILDYNNHIYQEYMIDCKKYRDIRISDEYSEMKFSELISEIGEEKPVFEIKDEVVLSILQEKKEMFKKHNTGFLVIMSNISDILQYAIEAEDFIDSLSWMIPVRFSNEIHDDPNLKELIEYFETPCEDFDNAIAADSYAIRYNGKTLARPVQVSDFRTNNAAFEISAGMGFISFRSDKITINNKNKFNGIRIYMNNFLLCDEKELIPVLSEYGYSNHTQNELIQTVRGIGSIIYILDKDNINENSRRTFIDVNTTESLTFLKEMGEFIDRIYEARYKLSKYQSAKAKIEIDKNKIEDLKKAAQIALNRLSDQKIELPDEEPEYGLLSDREKKQVIKKKITNDVNDALKQYMRSLTDFSRQSYDHAYDNFIIWLISQKKN